MGVGSKTGSKASLYVDISQLILANGAQGIKVQWPVDHLEAIAPPREDLRRCWVMARGDCGWKDWTSRPDWLQVHAMPLFVEELRKAASLGW